MTGEGMRRGLQGWISNRSEGQRYALALGLNLSFVAIVIAGFAALYLSGFDPGGLTGRDATPVESAQDVSSSADDDAEAALDRVFSDASRFSITAARDAYEETNGAATDGGLDVANSRDESAPERSPSEASPDDLVEFLAIDEGAEADEISSELLEIADAVGSDSDEGVSVAVVVGGSDDEPDASEPADAPEVSNVVSDAVVESVEAAPVAAAPAENSIGSLWAAAGELAAQLEREFPCGRFVLSAGSGGAPRLEGRVGAPDDRTAALARVAELFSGDADVELGLGCTATVGGGYVGLTDDRGRILLVTENDLSAPVRAVLPREGVCAVMGEVINMSTPLRDRLGSNDGSGGAPAAWIRALGAPALCEYDGEVWSIVPAPGGARRAGVIMIGDEVLASDVRRAADLSAGTATDGADGEGDGGDVDDEEQDDGFPQVAPLSGPAPRLPDGVASTADGYAVVIAFTVEEDGAPKDLSIVGAGLARVEVVAAALDVVAASRFAPPEEEAGSYRAVHTVRFPSAEFVELLERLSGSTARRNASPIWARSVTTAQMERAYPVRALQREITGLVELACAIRANGRLTCDIANEGPTGWGFGAAALELARRLRAEDTMSDGGPSAGAEIIVEFEFQTRAD